MSYQSAIGGSGIGYTAGGGLERIVYHSPAQDDSSGSIHYSAEHCSPQAPLFFYAGRQSTASVFYRKVESLLYAASEANRITKEYAFVPDDFLRPGRASQPFVGDAVDIEEPVKEICQSLGFAFPTDIRISVLPQKEFRKHASDQSVVGFSINRKQQGLVSDVFVLASEKDRVLLTVGHEIGHVLSRSLRNKQNEEAKAFAFTRAWMKAIQENDIACLGRAIATENPARNGLHDVAFAFVSRLLSAGKEAMALYWELVRGVVGVDAYAVSV